MKKTWTRKGRAHGVRDGLTRFQEGLGHGRRWLWLAALMTVLSGAGCMGPAPKYENEVGKGAHAWPLLDVSYSEKGRETDILWPLMAFNNLTHSKYYAVRPFCMAKTDPEDRLTSLDMLFPFFHTGKTGTRREFAVRPLLGLWRDPEKDITDVDVLFPFVNYRAEPEKTRFHLRPLVWYGNSPKKSYFHLFPLYGENHENYSYTRDGKEERVDKKRYFFLTPFFSYWRNRGKEPMDWSLNAFFPLTHFDRIGDSHCSWVLPLYYHKQSPRKRMTVVTPLYWDYARYDESDPGRVVTKTRMCFPLLGYSTGEDESWLSFGGNLLILKNQGDAGSVNVLWPFFHHGWTPKRHLSWMFPLYSYYGSDETDCLVVPPFYHYSHPESETRNVGLWPLFGYYRDDSWRSYSTAWPFFKYAHDDEGRTNVTFGGPLFLYTGYQDTTWRWSVLWPFTEWAREGASRHSRIFPLYLHWNYPERDTRYLHLLWPLMRYKSKKDRTDFRLLLPYMTYESEPDGHDFRVFWKWIQSTRSDSMQTFVFNPFYRQESNAEGDHYWSVLGGLISRKAKAENVDWTLFWLLGL